MGVMNIQTLKYELIEWVTKTNDSALLQTLKSIKDSNIASSDWLEKLTPAEQESLNRGINDQAQGKVLTSREFWADYEDNV